MNIGDVSAEYPLASMQDTRYAPEKKWGWRFVILISSRMSFVLLIIEGPVFAGRMQMFVSLSRLDCLEIVDHQ